MIGIYNWQGGRRGTAFMAETEEVVLHSSSLAEPNVGVELYRLEAPVYGSGFEKSNYPYTGLSKK